MKGTLELVELISVFNEVLQVPNTLVNRPLVGNQVKKRQLGGDEDNP